MALGEREERRARSTQHEVRTPLEVTTCGQVPRSAVSQATRRVEQIIAKAHRPVLRARIRLSVESNPAHERPAIAEIDLLVNGVPIRTRTGAATLTEAIDLAADRLQRQLVQLRERARDRHRWRTIGSRREWRRTGRPQRPDTGAGADRPVVRRKTVTLERMTADEAAYEMDLLDHDFYLYADARGTEAVVCRTDDGGYDVLVLPTAPVLTIAAARDRLRTGHERFVYFRPPDDDEHGRVLYLRHDGRYALLLATS